MAVQGNVGDRSTTDTLRLDATWRILKM